MFRVALDTNVLISAMAFGGSPAKIYDAWENNDFVMVLSGYILDEFARIARDKVKFDPTRLNLALANFYSIAEIVEPLPVEHPDIFPNDWPILGTAVAGKAGFLITGDKRILKLKIFYETEIVSPRQFLNQLLALGARKLK